MNDKPKNFAAAFAEMQAELPMIRRGQKGLVGNREFKYGGLPDVYDAIHSIVNKHGFSYRWAQDEKGVTCILSYADGNEARSFMPLPAIKMDETKYDSHRKYMQDVGLCLAQARRQTLVDVLGLISDDADADTPPTGDQGNKGKNQTPPPAPKGPTWKEVSFDEAFNWESYKAGQVELGADGKTLGAKNTSTLEYVKFEHRAQAEKYCFQHNLTLSV